MLLLVVCIVEVFYIDSFIDCGYCLCLLWQCVSSELVSVILVFYVSWDGIVLGFMEQKLCLVGSMLIRLCSGDFDGLVGMNWLFKVFSICLILVVVLVNWGIILVVVNCSIVVVLVLLVSWLVVEGFQLVVCRVVISLWVFVLVWLIVVCLLVLFLVRLSVCCRLGIVCVLLNSWWVCKMVSIRLSFCFFVGFCLRMCSLLWIWMFLILYSQLLMCSSMLLNEFFFGCLVSFRLWFILVVWISVQICWWMVGSLLGFSVVMLVCLLSNCFKCVMLLQVLVWVIGGIKWLISIVCVCCLVWVFLLGLLIRNGQISGRLFSVVLGLQDVDMFSVFFGNYFRLLCLFKCIMVCVLKLFENLVLSQWQVVRQWWLGGRFGLWQIVIGFFLKLCGG